MHKCFLTLFFLTLRNDAKKSTLLFVFTFFFLRYGVEIILFIFYFTLELIKFRLYIRLDFFFFFIKQQTKLSNLNSYFCFLILV